MIKKHLRVGQEHGKCLSPKGLVKLLIKIDNNHFEHLFIVCQNLKQPLLFGMDFAQHYTIGISWDHTEVSYLWCKGRKLMSAWLSSPMPQCVTGITNHVTDMDSASNRFRDQTSDYHDHNNTPSPHGCHTCCIFFSFLALS